MFGQNKAAPLNQQLAEENKALKAKMEALLAVNPMTELEKKLCQQVLELQGEVKKLQSENQSLKQTIRDNRGTISGYKDDLERTRRIYNNRSNNSEW